MKNPSFSEIPEVRVASPEIFKQFTGMNFPPGFPTPEQAPESPSGIPSFDSDDNSRPPPTTIPQGPEAAGTKTHPSVEEPATSPRENSEPVMTMNSAFDKVYKSLTDKQKSIVDDFADQLDFKDLFTNQRFVLRNVPIIPRKLRATFTGMSQDELIAFWQSFSDLKGSPLYLDALIAKRYCVKVVTGLNGKDFSEEAREALFSSLDHSVIEFLFNYAKLFEIARMKVLHGGFVEANPT